ncbi:MAG: GTP-binding protein, partial [Candidatus Heimdallarchaeota archaeon]|nr:GTP-binding protein [Candidatus Heimdallarchaeota archaeon]MCK4771074.1 GTP-binding protein [Candidatus Heimdallarchaeota archaeon]
MSQRIFKITLLGEGAVGKTSLRRRYLGESFKEGYMMTIGADFAVKKMNLNQTEYTLQIWDLAGQQRFSAVREVYYRGTAGALLVFDISRPETYEILPNWLHELIRNNKNRIVPLVLIGNKSDLRDSTPYAVPKDYAMEYADQLSQWSGFYVPYMETSAKTGLNVEQVFSLLTESISQYFERMTVEH